MKLPSSRAQDLPLIIPPAEHSYFRNIVIRSSSFLIGASLSEPHTSELVLKNLLRSMYVYINFRDVRSGTVLIRIYLIACSKISINQLVS